MSYQKIPDVEFFNLLWPRIEKIVPLNPDDIVGDGRNITLPPDLRSNTTELYIRYYPPSVLERLEQLLSKAEKEADDERSRGWLRLTRDQFDFAKLLTQALISYRLYQKDKTRENWLDLKKRVEDFDAHRIKIVTYPKEYTDRWFPGHGEFCKWITGGAVKETISFYVSWEERKMDVLRKGIKGTAMGHGDSYYYSFIKEPLTLDFAEK